MKLSGSLSGNFSFRWRTSLCQASSCFCFFWSAYFLSLDQRTGFSSMNSQNASSTWSRNSMLAIFGPFFRLLLVGWEEAWVVCCGISTSLACGPFCVAGAWDSSVLVFLPLLFLPCVIFRELLSNTGISTSISTNILKWNETLSKCRHVCHHQYLIYKCCCIPFIYTGCDSQQAIKFLLPC